MHTQVREKSFAATTSVLAAIFLTSFKLLVALMTGSLGILAEAAHSGLDLVAALITLFAVRVSDRPADQEHLYGHGKVENLSALAETLLLLLTCAWIVYEAVDRLFFSLKEVDPSIWAFLIMGTSIVIDFSRSRVLARAAKKFHSQALEADALHFSTDIWSSSVVIIGLALVALGELIGKKAAFMRADSLAALIVACIVIYISMQLGKRTVDALLDRAPSGLTEQIAAAVARVPSVHQVGNLRARAVGNKSFVDLSIYVPRHFSFEESHAVTREVQDSVHLISPNADVVVHAVPSAEDEGILERIQATAARGHYAIHNTMTHWTNRGIWIDMDLEVDPTLTMRSAHALASDLEGLLRAEFQKDHVEDGPNGVADINIHIEPRAEELLEGKEISSREAKSYLDEIETIQRELPRVFSVQDIQLQRLDGKVYLSFHAIVDPECSVSEVHILSEEMENQLRQRFPQLGRVVIHGEPTA
jgi:cation diffusion facilitator family transporter